MTWTQVWERAALRDLRNLGQLDRQRVLAAVERLAATEQGDVRRLQDTTPPEWRLRVGNQRVRFRFETTGHTLRILRVLPRGRAYRD